MKTAFMRRGEVYRWLVEEIGLKGRHVKAMMECNTIIKLYLPGRPTRALFSRAQIERDVVAKLMV